MTRPSKVESQRRKALAAATLVAVASVVASGTALGLRAARAAVSAELQPPGSSDAQGSGGGRPIAPPAAPSAPGQGAADRAKPPFELEAYQLVLLRRGPAWTPEKTPATEKIQAEHMAHLRKMGESGKMVVAGPFGHQPDPALRGLCLYRVGSLEEARRLAEQDPAVKARRLAVEALTWYVEKGALSFPQAAAQAPKTAK